MLTGQHIAQHHAAFFIREKRKNSLDGNSWCLYIYKAPATLQNQSASHTIYGNQSIKELYVRAQLYIGKRDRIETRSERDERRIGAADGVMAPRDILSYKPYSHST